MKRNFYKFMTGTICALSSAIMAVSGTNEVLAASETKLEVSSANGYEGDTVKVTVSLEDNEGIAAAVFRLTYDSDVLSVVSAEEAEGAILSRPTIREDGVGFVGYSYADVEDITESGDLLVVEFKIAEDAAIGDTTLSFSNLDFSNADEDTVEVTPVGGKVTVNCAHKTTKEHIDPATCTTAGKKQMICEKCNVVVSEDAIAATGHTWGEAEVTVEPTCTTVGKSVAECVNCDATKENELAATGHTWGEAEVAVEPTCTVVGKSVTKCADCDATKESEIAATGHTWGEAEVTVEPTCTESGKATKACKNCDATEDITIEAKGHVFAKYEVTKEATQEAKGEITLTCSECEEVVKKEIPALKDVKVSLNLKEEYEVGSVAEFTAVGTGNVNPTMGDVRFVPVSWNAGDVETKWETSDFKAVLNTDKSGDYNVTVTYALQIFGSTGWETQEQTIQTQAKFKVVEKVEKETETKVEDNKNDSENQTSSTKKEDDNVKTGDSSAMAVVGFVMLSILAGAAVVVSRKRELN